MTHSGQIHTEITGFVCAVLAGVLISGCSAKPQQLVFTMAGEPHYFVRHFWFFPVVEIDGELVLGEYQVKTFDASGYQEWEASATQPRSLLNGWRTPNLKGYERVGLVILREDDEMKPLLDTARIFWLEPETINSTSDETYVEIPRFESLDKIELQPQWRE